MLIRVIFCSKREKKMLARMKLKEEVSVRQVQKMLKNSIEADTSAVRL